MIKSGLALLGLSLGQAARVTDGLVYHLKFDEAQSVLAGSPPGSAQDSAGGSTLGDLSIGSGASFIAKTQGIQLDGTAPLITPNNIETMITEADFTFEVWVEETQGDNLEFPRILLGLGDDFTTAQGDSAICSVPDRSLALSTSGTTTQLRVRVAANRLPESGSGDPICAETTKIHNRNSLSTIFWAGSASLQIWADGSSAETDNGFTVGDEGLFATPAFVLQNKPLVVGAGGWSGKIKQLAIYNRVLTPGERAANVEAGLPNSRPHAQDFSASVVEDTSGPVMNQLGASTPSDTDWIYDYDYASSDADRNTLDVIVLTAPQHGTLYDGTTEITSYPATVDLTAGALNYKGDLNYYNDNDAPDDTFTFKVSDGALESEVRTASVVVTNVDDPPVPTDQELDFLGTQVTITLQGAETDAPASDGLYIKTLPAAGVLKLMNGTVITAGDLPRSVPYNAASLSGQVIYELASLPSFSDGDDVLAQYDFDFYFTNSGILSPDGTVVIDVKNPLQTGTITASINEDEPTAIVFIGSDARDANADWAVILTEIPDANDAVFTLPNGSPVTVNSSTGVQNLTLTPAQDWSGSVTFRYSIQSNGVVSANLGTGTVTVVAVNDAPVFTLNIVNSTIPFEGYSRYSLDVTDVDGPVGGAEYAGYTVELDVDIDPLWLPNETGRIDYNYPPPGYRAGVSPQDGDWGSVGDDRLSPPVIFQADNLTALNAAVNNLTVFFARGGYVLKGYSPQGKINMLISVTDTKKNPGIFGYAADSRNATYLELLTLGAEDGEGFGGEETISDLGLIIIYASAGGCFLTCLSIGLCLAYRKWAMSKDVLAAHSGDDQYEDRL